MATSADLSPRVLGILNVTPDSFSDGGEYSAQEAAIARGLELHEQGADIIDVGGESTRPGADRVPADKEQERVIPVISALVAAGATVSVDTMNAETALAAAEAGVTIINDVSGGLADPAMYGVVASTGLTYIAMHWRGHSSGMDDLARYRDVVADVRLELTLRLAEMIISGVQLSNVILDPGLGFAKTAEHNWQLLGHLDELGTLGHRVLVGASRKKFLATFAAPDAAAIERDPASSVISALAAQAGVWGVRVHNVQATRMALGVWADWDNGRRS